ncbi:RNA-directed DNA polymerase, eukaryota, reverse transcriptase zinc-binding domain protein [Tanacetum coccineum]
MAGINSKPNGWTWDFGKNNKIHSKPIDNLFLKDVEKIATSFMNLPNSFDAKNLWKEFQLFRQNVDAFIANKQSKQGKCFGFVRFMGVHNEDDFAKSLSNVWIGSYHVFVSVTRFQQNSKNESSPQNKPATKNSNLDDNIKIVELGECDLIKVKDTSSVALVKVKEVNVSIHGEIFQVRVKLIGTWSIHILNDIESIDSDEGQDVVECRSFNENVDPIEALDDFIQQTIEKKQAMKTSSQVPQSEGSIPPGFEKEHIINDVAPSREGKEGDASMDPVKNEHTVTHDDKLSDEVTSENSKLPGFEFFARITKIVLNHPTPHEQASAPPHLPITLERN